MLTHNSQQRVKTNVCMYACAINILLTNQSSVYPKEVTKAHVKEAQSQIGYH